jgi:hypothetical protein
MEERDATRAGLKQSCRLHAQFDHWVHDDQRGDTDPDI